MIPCQGVEGACLIISPGCGGPPTDAWCNYWGYQPEPGRDSVMETLAHPRTCALTSLYLWDKLVCGLSLCLPSYVCLDKACWVVKVGRWSKYVWKGTDDRTTTILSRTSGWQKLVLGAQVVCLSSVATLLSPPPHIGTVAQHTNIANWHHQYCACYLHHIYQILILFFWSDFHHIDHGFSRLLLSNKINIS